MTYRYLPRHYNDGVCQNFRIRATTRTERRLQAIIAFQKQTFWGEAVNSILELCSRSPEFFQDTPLPSQAPTPLFLPRPFATHFVPIFYSRVIMCNITQEAFDFVQNQARIWDDTQLRTATTITHFKAAEYLKLIESQGDA